MPGYGQTVGLGGVQHLREPLPAKEKDLPSQSEKRLEYPRIEHQQAKSARENMEKPVEEQRKERGGLIWSEPTFKQTQPEVPLKNVEEGWNMAKEEGILLSNMANRKGISLSQYHSWVCQSVVWQLIKF